MNKVNSMIDSENLNEEYRNLAKNSFYSLLGQYSTIISSIITSIFIARLISQELWGILILATSIIILITIITFFIPPALEYSIRYYISKYITLNQNSNLKSFIKKALVIKIIVLIFSFLIGIFILQFITKLIIIEQKEKFILVLYILTPLIFVFGLNPILNSINQGFNNFKIIFVLFLIKSVFNISALIIVFLFIENVQIESIAIINLFTELIPFILNCIIVLKKYFKIKFSDEKGLSYKEFRQMTVKYGSPICFNYLEYTLWNELQIQGIGLLNRPQLITGYNISLSYSNVAKYASSSLHIPLTTSFARLNVSDNLESINSIYNLIIKYSLFILLFFSGIMFFVADFYLFIIYGDSYLSFSNYLKIMVISIVFRVLITPFDSLLYAQNRTKLLPPIRIIMLIIQILIFFIGLIYFGINGAIVGVLFINIILFLLFSSLNFKILKIKLNLKKIFLQYLTLFLSISIVALLEFYIFKNLFSLLIQILNLEILRFLPLFSMFSFILLFLTFNILFKIFSSKDIEYLESYLKENSRIQRYIGRVLKFFKKLLIQTEKS